MHVAAGHPLTHIQGKTLGYSLGPRYCQSSANTPT